LPTPAATPPGGTNSGKRPNPAEMMLWTIEDLSEQDLADLSPITRPKKVD